MDPADLSASILRPAEAWQGETDPAEWDLELLLNTPVLQSLMEDYAKLTLTVTAILDLKGKVLVAVGWQDICTRFHRVHPDCSRFCTESDLYLAGNVKRGEYVAYKCRSGLWDVVTPLYVADVHKGNIYTGQFFYDDEEVDHAFFEAQAQAYGFDREAYLAALDRVPRFSRAQVKRLMDFLVKFTDLVSRFTLGNLRAVTFIREQARSAQALREAEAARRESQAMVSQILDTIPQSVFWKDAEGRYLGCNRAFAAMADCSDPAQLLGKTDFEMPWSREEAEAFRADDRDVLDRNQPRLGISERLSLPGGRSLQIETSKVPLRDDEGKAFAVVGVFEDVTERRRTEAERRNLEMELEHFQKLESLGRLAAGVAHDMNNTLSAILSVAEALRIRHAGVPDLGASLDLIDKAAGRARDLVKTLVGFSRKEMAQFVGLDVNELVRVEMGLLDRTLMKKYELVMDLMPGLPNVSGDPSALATALMNLCVNAVDAMPEGGRLTVSTRNPEGTHVEIQVSDTGTGMPPEVLQRSVEPFFTTKATGKGTGLGLSQVFNTARAHDGFLRMESEPGKGTRAILALPCGPGMPPGAVVETAVPAQEHLEILLVDDEELVRSTIPMMLGFLGHRVTPVPGGREALEHLETQGEPDLIILDMNMPGMTGLETWEAIRTRFKDLRILVATGFLEERVSLALAADPAAGTLTKPYTLAEFQAAVGRLGVGR